MSAPFNTHCAGTGPTQGGMVPRAPDGSSQFYGRATKEPRHEWKMVNGHLRLVVRRELGEAAGAAPP